MREIRYGPISRASPITQRRLPRLSLVADLTPSVREQRKTRLRQIGLHPDVHHNLLFLRAKKSLVGAAIDPPAVAKKGITRMRRTILVGGLFALSLSSAITNVLGANERHAQAESPPAARSAPPDTRNYSREAVPEDIAPCGKPALGPNVTTRPRPNAAQATSKPGGQGKPPTVVRPTNDDDRN
jgi:hypothetical protein